MALIEHKYIVILGFHKLGNFIIVPTCLANIRRSFVAVSIKSRHSKAGTRQHPLSGYVGVNLILPNEGNDDYKKGEQGDNGPHTDNKAILASEHQKQTRDSYDTSQNMRAAAPFLPNGFPECPSHRGHCALVNIRIKSELHRCAHLSCVNLSRKSDFFESALL